MKNGGVTLTEKCSTFSLMLILTLTPYKSASSSGSDIMPEYDTCMRGNYSHIRTLMFGLERSYVWGKRGVLILGDGIKCPASEVS